MLLGYHYVARVSHCCYVLLLGRWLLLVIEVVLSGLTGSAISELILTVRLISAQTS